MPLHYLFLDESYRQEASGDSTIIMASWIVEQNRYRRELSDFYKPPILETIRGMFDVLDAHAVVAWSTINATVFRAGEIDATNDVKAMKRRDNVWSQCSVFAVAMTIKLLLLRGIEVGTVDIFHDPKSLTADHIAAFEATLRQSVAPVGKRYATQLGSNLLRKLSIRRIQPVKKALSIQARDKFQIGTWVADRLCSHLDDLRECGDTARIRTYDMSEEVRRTAQQFDGKSFWDS